MSITTIIPPVTTPSYSSAPAHQIITNFQNGLTSGVNSVTFPLQSDVPVPPMYTFVVVPAAAADGCVVPTQATVTIPANGSIALPLTTVATGTAPNITAQPYTLNGVPGILLDMERNVVLEYTATANFNVQITGFDFRGQAFISTSTINHTLNALPLGILNLVTGVTLINTTGAPIVATGVSVGTASATNGVATQIGLPYFLKRRVYVVALFWAGNLLSVSTTSVLAGFLWRTPLDDEPSQASVRGLIQLPSQADGAKKLVCTCYVYGADSELENLLVNQNQSAYKIANIQPASGSAWTAATPVLVQPNLNSYDLTGMQLNQGVIGSGANPLHTASGGADILAYQAYQNAITPGTVVTP